MPSFREKVSNIVPSWFPYFGKPPECETPVPIDVIAKANDLDFNQHYPDNYITTSKYTIFTFMPLNLFYQFNRVSNIYFLSNMVVSLIPGLSPLTPMTAIAPLIFVVGVAMIKDGYEDFQRHVMDRKANGIQAKIIRKNLDTGKDELIHVYSKDIQVGDLIQVKLGEEIRADVVLISSSATECQAFIDTCNLDGETNLKCKKAVEATWELNTIEKLTSHEILIRTGQPNSGLLQWTGIFILDGKEYALGLDQFLYRSSVLRNTDWIWGFVIYAGVDTKMFLNLQDRPPKSSNLDKTLNKLIIGVLCIQIVLLCILATSSVIWIRIRLPQHWYLATYGATKIGFILWVSRFLSYFILFSFMIPISLFVTIELCKVSQALFMMWDVEMFSWLHGEWKGCVVKSSNLNEELSRVKYIFSDKTGTLTENIMIFKQGDVFGNPVYSEDPDAIRQYLSDENTREPMENYLLALAICHTIQPFEDSENPGQLKYEGASPDEVALVTFAAENSFVLKERSVKSITLEILSEIIKFDIVAILEFTSDRKMMSVIVKNTKTGKTILYTKGADTYLLPQLHGKSPNYEVLPDTINALKNMGNQGLRTLLLASKDLTDSEAELQSWIKEFTDAGKILGEERSARVDEVCLKMESDLNLIGGTAIEDKLQDQVPETLEFLLEAEIVVWMLTGDKRETAVTIAATSGLMNPQEDYIDYIDIGSAKSWSDEAVVMVETQLKVIEEHINEGDARCTMVLDGNSLMTCIENHFEQFLAISEHVNSAVCCRLTPLQKAYVVRMFQKKSGKTALAVGDGANDVSMIQESQVGVGIIGLEGAQAALAADYAIPRFKHLRRLLAVHGRYSLVRNTTCILVCFYKNICITLPQFYFAFYTRFSGTSLYDGWMLTLFNIVFTAIPPFLIGVFEKDLPEDVLLDTPHVYSMLEAGAYFSGTIVVKWLGTAVIHSLFLFYVMFPYGENLDTQNNKKIDFTMFGTVLFCCIVILCLGKIALHIKYWIWIQLYGFLFSITLLFVLMCVYAIIPNFFGDTSFYMSAFIIMTDPKFWLYILFFILGVLIFIDMSSIFVQKKLYPNDVDLVQREYEI